MGGMGGSGDASDSDLDVGGAGMSGPAGGTAEVECAVWWADPASARPELLGLLDESERARHARFRRGADRDRYAVAHALARLVCAREAGCGPREVEFTLRCRSCEREGRGGGDGQDGDGRSGTSGREAGGNSTAGRGPQGPHGKPHPAGPASGWEISISHSGDRVALAVTRGVPVGVDVEQIKAARDIDGLAGYALTETERDAWESLPESERTAGFFTYWSRKEALLKATGDGLSGGLASVVVSAPNAPAKVIAWHALDAPSSVRLTDLDAGPAYRAALAVLTPEEVRITEHDAAGLLGGAELLGGWSGRADRRSPG